MKKLMKLAKNEDGQALVLVALAMVILIGFAALVVDVGTLYVTRAKLQNAADAAALAGAKDLPISATDDTAVKTAVDYASKNELIVSLGNIVTVSENVSKASGDTGTDSVTVTTPYNNANKIKVACTRTVPAIFSFILHSTGTDVSAYAVAQKEWDGEALPFINLAGNYTPTPTDTNPTIVIWNSVAPGNKETMASDSFYIRNYNPYSVDKTYFEITYMDGILLRDGFSNGQGDKDKNGQVNKALDTILAVGSKYYCFSLKSDLINHLLNNDFPEGEGVLLTDGSRAITMDELKNTKIDPSQFVLLEGVCTSFDKSNEHHINLTNIKEYDVMNGDLPPDYINPYGGTSKLVE